ncbi:hypothetical protein EAY09_25710, partial [Vibrio anguillarum]|nr:hypothetical protein [Vibrio anguillarum]
LTDNCEAYYPDVNGQPNLDYTPPQLTKFACESCKKPLILSNPKEGNPNRYFYCSVPKCKFITKAKMENTDWIPDLSEYIRDHQHQCPKCQKNYLKFIISREHQNKLWVCQGSPRCKTFLDDLNGAPDIEAFRQKQLLENSLIDCPSCGKGKLRKSKNKENLFYCSNISLKGKSKCKTFINGNENGEPDIDGWKEGTKGGAAIKVNTNMT